MINHSYKSQQHFKAKTKMKDLNNTIPAGLKQTQLLGISQVIVNVGEKNNITGRK